jgi:hypothetical protein
MLGYRSDLCEYSGSGFGASGGFQFDDRATVYRVRGDRKLFAATERADRA